MTAATLDYDTSVTTPTTPAQTPAQTPLWHEWPHVPVAPAYASSAHLSAGELPSAEAAYYASIAVIPLLHPATEAALARRAAAGDREARRRLYEANLRLIWTETRRIVRWYGVRRSLWLDVVQGANEIVWRRMDGYTVERGRFTTYLACLLQGSVPRIIDDLRLTIHRPAGVLERERHAAKLETEVERATYWAEVSEDGKAPPAPFTVVSLDKPHGAKQHGANGAKGDAEAFTLASQVADVSELADVAGMATRLDTGERLAALITRTLSGTMRTVILLAYSNDYRYAAPNPKYPANFEAIGDTLGISRERVRQLHNAALLRLRSAAYRSPDIRELAGV